MSNNMTTTRNGFRVEDVTFRRARRQSEIDNEIEQTEETSGDTVKAPVSLTPEQVKSFYVSKIAFSTDSNEKRLYAQTIKWIDELQDTKKKLLALEAKEVKETEENINGEDIEQ